MNILRRDFLKGSAISILALAGSGLLKPSRVLAADWAQTAFNAKNSQDAIKGLGLGNPIESRDIQIKAPDIAENGAKVEIEIQSLIPDTRSLSVFADNNPMPLVATAEFFPPLLPYWRLPMKLAESTRIRVVAKTASGKTFIATQEIKVTLGGCGG